MEEESPNIYNKYSGRKFIYLDLKYWILLRDSEKGNDPIEKQIVAKINQLHSAGKCIFPISDIVYYEIMKQGDEAKRMASIALVDKYSEGLAMVSAKHQLQIEFGYWVKKMLNFNNLIEPKKCVWSNINLVIGFPGFAQQAEHLNIELQKYYFDFVSKIPLQYTHSNPSVLFEPFTGKDDVDALNEGKEKYKDQNKTFKAMFLSELEGFIQEFKVPLNEEIYKLQYIQTGSYPTPEEKQNDNADAYCKLIFHLFRQDKLTTELPLFKIYPSLFGMMRWNKNRTFQDGNDTMDVLHATHALPYCNYFFTEKELKSMIVQLGLDRMFGCVVESNPGKVLEILNAI